MNRKLLSTCFIGAACAALLIAATGCGTTIGDDSAVDDRSDARSEARSDARTAPAPVVARTVAPAGSVLSVEFIDPLSSETAQPGQTFRARVTRPLTVDGRTAIPSGAVVIGTVREANPANRFGGKASLDLGFDRIELPSGKEAPLSAAFYAEERGEKKRDAIAIGGGAAGGAILGRILNDDDRAEGTKDGAIAGAVIGTVVAASTKGDAVEIRAGAPATIRLEAPVTL